MLEGGLVLWGGIMLGNMTYGIGGRIAGTSDVSVEIPSWKG